MDRRTELTKKVAEFLKEGLIDVDTAQEINSYLYAIFKAEWEPNLGNQRLANIAKEYLQEAIERNHLEEVW